MSYPYIEKDQPMRRFHEKEEIPVTTTLGRVAVEQIYELSEGNPGALTVIMEMMGRNHNPLYAQYLLRLKNIGVTGDKLYMLWNDCCDRNFDLMYKVLSMHMADKISAEELLSHIRGDGCRGYPFIGIEEVKSGEEENETAGE